MGNGYIKVPRELFESAEWRKRRVFGRIEAQLDLLQMASYIEGRVIHCATSDVVLHRGQLLTTMRTLADRWNWSSSSVHRFLTLLRKPATGDIRIEIETHIETGKTLITIVEYDMWESSDAETEFGTIGGTIDGTRFGTNKIKHAEHANNCNSESLATERNNDFANSGTSFETAPETRSGTTNGTILELKYSNKGIIKDRNTHTVDTCKGGVGEKMSQAMELLLWLADTHPSLARIRKPLTIEYAIKILDQYDIEDAKYIIGSMADDMVTLTKGNFEQRFNIFSRLDKSVKPKREKERIKHKRYNYNEYCDEITSGRATGADFQHQRDENGKLYWIKKTK